MQLGVAVHFQSLVARRVGAGSGPAFSQPMHACTSACACTHTRTHARMHARTLVPSSVHARACMHACMLAHTHARTPGAMGAAQPRCARTPPNADTPTRARAGDAGSTARGNPHTPAAPRTPPARWVQQGCVRQLQSPAADLSLTHAHARMCVCMQAHTHARTHAHTRTHTHARMHARMHTHARRPSARGPAPCPAA